jgi:hypothetical protein
MGLLFALQIQIRKYANKKVVILYAYLHIRVTKASVLQLALAKGHFAYNFKFLRRQYCAHPNQNSLIIVPQFPHRTGTMLKSPFKESDNGLPCKMHYEFISWKPVILKSPIDFNHPTLLIEPIRITDFHHPQPENTQAPHVNNASCFTMAAIGQWWAP